MRNIKITNYTKKIFTVSFILIVSTIIFVSISKKSFTAVPHHNLIDTKISQYSDSKITKNAILTDKKFQQIVFEPNLKKTSLWSQIASVVSAVKSLTDKNQTKNFEEYGTWIWTPIMDMSPEYMDTIIAGAQKNNINVIYVSIDSYLDIFVMQNGKEKERQKEIFSQKLEDFIVKANRKGIAVDAEAGWRNWAEEEHVYKAFAIVNFVKNFNETHKNKFRGFQYDVEPYLLDSYQEDQETVLRNFIGLIDSTQIFLNNSDLKFSVVVPDFWDGKDNMTSKFFYNNKKDFVFDHLLNIIDRQKYGSIIIMSYRNFALGEDGAIAISENEMQTAKNSHHKTKIIIAQETGEVPPPYITFHGTSKEYLTWEIQKIKSAFASNSNFGGIAIHYANAFLALR